jgi:hypothetical protein
VHGGNVLLTSSNLTQFLDRGDVVLIGDEVFTVSNDTSRPFTSSEVPLQSSSVDGGGYGYLRSKAAKSSDCGGFVKYCVDCDECRHPEHGYAPIDRNLAVYKGGSGKSGTGTHTVRFTPYIRGEYRMDVRLLRTVEVQSISTNCSSESKVSGSFMLSYGGINSKTIRFDANASLLQSKLEELPSITKGSIAVSLNKIDASTNAREWLVTFVTRYGDVSEMIGFDDAGLLGNGAAVYIA